MYSIVRGGRRLEKRLERNLYVFVMIYEYIELESLNENDIGYVVEAESRRKVAYIGALIMRPSLLEERVHGQSWDWFSFQTMDNCIVDEIDSCPSVWSLCIRDGLHIWVVICSWF